MYIKEIDIHEFGIFKDFRIKKISPNLNLIYGENEAGKTTLMAFIRQILFGFPSKGQKNKKRYDFPEGIRAGGSINLQMKSKETLKINRHDGPKGGNLSVQINEGSDYNNHLPRELDASREDLYRNIFAFGLDELQNFATLENDSISDIIYSAMMGSSGKNLVEVNKQLDNSMGELYKARGSTQKINTLLRSIKDIKDKIKECHTYINEYDNKHAERELRENDLAVLEEKLNSLKKEKQEIELICELKNDWNELQLEKEELNTLIIVFKNENNISPKELKKNLEDIGRQLILLIEGKAKYKAAKNDLPELQSELKLKEKTIDNKLDELGKGWDVNRALKQNISIEFREDIREFKEKLKDEKDELNRTKDEKRTRQLMLEESEIKEKISRESVEEIRKTFRNLKIRNTFDISKSLFFGFFSLLFGAAVAFFYSTMAGLISSIVLLLLGCFLLGVLYYSNRVSIKGLLKQKESDLSFSEKDLARVEKEHNETIKIHLQQNEIFEKAIIDWEGRLKELELPKLNPDGILEILLAVKELKKDHDIITGLKERIKLIKETLEIFETSAQKLSEQMGKELPKNIGAAEIVDDLDDNIRSIKVKYDKITKLEYHIKSTAGSEKMVEWLREKLPESDIAELNEKMEDIIKHIDEHEYEKTEHLKEIGALNDGIKKLEQNTDTSDLLNQREMLKAEINSEAERWAVYKIARTLLDQARSRYETERQPYVMKAAEKHFSIISGGRYNQVRQPLDDTKMFIDGENEYRKNVGEHLSRGTAEELYFAIRLGLISDFSKSEDPLPVVMDDIFVNMDDRRQAAAIKTLASLTKTNQVFVFTCHKQTKDLIMNIFPDAQLIMLDNGRLN